MNNTLYQARLDTLYQAIDNNASTTNLTTGPLIGISANYREGNSCIENSYALSILQAGGLPVLIPVFTDIKALQALVSRLDGLLLSGGGDINPLYAGEEPLPPLQEVDAYRDQYDLTLVRLAANQQIPIFGICRGHQILNLAFGGKNYQDIYSQREIPTLKHSQTIGREHGSHTVRLLPDTTLAHLLQKESLVVNSFHHQAVQEVAPGFTVSALSPDGIVEAMEGMPGRRVFSVQWHPEKMTLRPDEDMQHLFSFFIQEATLFQQAKRIHRECLIVDSHCDTPMKFTPDFDLGRRHADDVKVDLPKLQEGRVDAVFMVAYLPQGPRDEASLQAATRQAIDILYQIGQQVQRHPEAVEIAYTTEDLLRLKNQNKRAIFLGVENGYAIGRDLQNLQLFKEMGVSYITLCHNESNDLCDSAKGIPEHGGLSPLGREAVREMNRLGLLIDLSHTSEQTFYDVLAESTKPVIASHSSARALCDHPRNLTDEQIQALAARGGVVQVCLYPHFLNREQHPTLLDAIAHINHIVRLVGINHVGIGSDFDGDDSEHLPGCRASNELINLTVELLRQGYTPEELAKLWGDNLLRVLNAQQ